MSEIAVKPNKAKRASFSFRQYAMIVALIILFILFTVMTKGSFIQTRNLSNLARQMAITGVLATGMAMVIVSGNIDLSVGTLLGFIGGIGAAGMVWWGWDMYTTIAVQLLLGLTVGLIQGSIIAYLRMPAFITTLGAQLIFRGATLGVIRGTTVAPLPKGYVYLGQAYVSMTLGWIFAVVAIGLLFYFMVNKRKSNMKYKFEVKSLSVDILKASFYSLLIIGFVWIMNNYKGIPLPVIIMLALSIIFTFVAEKITFGRSVYAIGGNREAAKYAGINVNRITIIVFMLSGLMSGVAGIIMSARLNAGAPQAGLNMETDAIAAAVIGGISMTGGIGRVSGALIGAVVMATLDNGMSMMNIQAFWQFIVKGAVLIIAVWFDISSKNKQK
ncbi:MAG: sugar ABC transporter permease [Eubacteriales bacterium]|nr:sugar ABC transporter permease [Eubacteriales bacterium]